LLSIRLSGTGSTSWGLDKVAERAIQEMGDPSNYSKISTETARSWILSFKTSWTSITPKS
jgi:hypothetical protein